MKPVRLVLSILVLLFSASLAFAGPLITVGDPQCSGNETYKLSTLQGTGFVITDPTQAITVCNDTEQNFSNLNFTFDFAPTVFNLATIYCGAPDSGPAAFDTCSVLDPTTNTLIHTFAAGTDTPTSFYQSYSCSFGCNTETPPTIDGTSVHLSFNLTPILLATTFATDSDYESPCNSEVGRDGLLAGCTFTIAFNCPSTDGAVSCDSIPVGTRAALLASNTFNNTTFPTVPEPASIFLMAGGVLPLVFRKIRGNRRT
jgi:hypothetical protein